MSYLDYSKLEPEHRMFVLELSNKQTYIVSETTKDNITRSKSQFVELEDGSIVNKSFIVNIRYSVKDTTAHLKRLPMDLKNKIIEQITDKTSLEYILRSLPIET